MCNIPIKYYMDQHNNQIKKKNQHCRSKKDLKQKWNMNQIGSILR